MRGQVTPTLQKIHLRLKMENSDQYRGMAGLCREVSLVHRADLARLFLRGGIIPRNLGS